MRSRRSHGWRRRLWLLQGVLLSLIYLCEVHADGQSGCKCIGLPSTIPTVDCAEDYAFNGLCIVPPALDIDGDGDFDPVLYAADYGAMCKEHPDVGSAFCYNLATGEELSVDKRATWCDKPWCYIDPANCDVDGHSTSNYGWMTSDCASTATSAEVDVMYTPHTCLVSYSYETCGASDDYTAPSYIEAKRDYMMVIVAQFMNAPLDSITNILPMFERRVISLSDPLWGDPRRALSDSLYAQTLGLKLGEDGVPYSMVYVGLDDGTFTGYFSPTSHTLRAPSGAPGDLPWVPWTLGTVNQACTTGACARTFEMACTAGTVPGCEPQVVANQGFQDACAVHTIKTSCASVDSDVDAGTRDCTFTGPCSGPSGKTVAEACPTEDSACVHADVRNYYTTSVDAGGHPLNFTRWREYNPLVRPWYIQGKMSWTDAQKKLGYSGVYQFTTTKELGITAMGAIVQEGVFRGPHQPRAGLPLRAHLH